MSPCTLWPSNGCTRRFSSAEQMTSAGRVSCKRGTGRHPSRHRYAPSLMTGQERSSTICRVNRRTSAWCSGLLIIVQMMTAPVAHPLSGGAAIADSGQAAASLASQGRGDGGHCPPAAHESSGDGRQDHTRANGHDKCACPCGHTPALATATFAALKPVPPADAAGELKGPTFTPPRSDILRPPN